MTYRDDIEATENRREDLARRLRDIRQRKASLRGLEAAEASVQKELEDCTRELRARRAKQALPLLDRIEIASPCSERWEDMIGDARVRFCGSCQKNVYDLSQMRRDEAEELLRTSNGSPCVRLYRRADGTVLTADCPVGRRRARVRKITITALGAGLLGVLSNLFVVPSAGHVTGAPAVTGSVMVPPCEVPPKAEPPAAPMGSVRVPTDNAPRMGLMTRKMGML